MKYGALIVEREASTTGAVSTSGVTAAGVSFSTIASLSVSVVVGFGTSAVSPWLAATLVTWAFSNAGVSTNDTSNILAAVTNK